MQLNFEIHFSQIGLSLIKSGIIHIQYVVDFGLKNE